MRTSDTTTTPWTALAGHTGGQRGQSLGDLCGCAKTGFWGASGQGSGRRTSKRGPEGTGRSQMILRQTVRSVVAATALTAAVVAVPASAGPSHSNVGSSSVYGLDRHFTLVGHTDLAKRGMNSPIAVAGTCVYVGDRYYSSSTDGNVRPNGGFSLLDVS